MSSRHVSQYEGVKVRLKLRLSDGAGEPTRGMRRRTFDSAAVLGEHELVEPPRRELLRVERVPASTLQGEGRGA